MSEQRHVGIFGGRASGKTFAMGKIAAGGEQRKKRMKVDDFEALLPPHEGELILTHNEHRSNYYTVAEHLDGPLGDRLEFVSDDERSRAIEVNELWTLQWYPDTPVGFHTIAASSLQAICDWLAQEKSA